MVLYKFSINSKGICREQIEVEEKEKTFQKQVGLSKQVFKKSELDIVTYSYGSPEMISLKGNPEKFVRAVIEHKKNKINQLEKQLATEKNFIIKLKSEYSNVLINRVDEVICFNRLTEENFRGIAKIMLDELVASLGEKGITFTYEPSLVDLLTEKSYSITYGARNLRRAIQKELEDPMAIRIIDSYDNPVTHVRASAEDGKVRIEAL